MTDDASIPDPIRRLADARADARASRDFATADRLKTEIEAAGWRVVDRGFSYRLARAYPPDREVDGLTLYGRVSSVPSRLDEPPTSEATVVIVADPDDPSPAMTTLEGLRLHAPLRTDAVVVMDGAAGHLDVLRELADASAGPGALQVAPSAPESGAEAAATRRTDGSEPGVEVIATSTRLGHAGALSIGTRRAGGAVVIVLEAGIEVRGDIVAPLIHALTDPTVAIVGAKGLVTHDLHRFEPAPGGAGGGATVDAVTEAVMAFRRVDAAGRGPLDDRLRTRRGIAIWWSLVLRDMGEDVASRRAVSIPDLPISLATRAVAEPSRTSVDDVGPAADERRLRKRDGYRIADRFGHRRDLGSG